MMFEALVKREAAGTADAQKRPLLLAGLNELTAHHYKLCPSYKNIVDAAFGGRIEADAIEQVPYLPASLFKRLVLSSTPKPILTLRSSGTSGQQPSQIIIDAETSERQSRGLLSIFHSVLGAKRIPLLVIDSRSVVMNPQTITARGAGILGMMKFGAKTAFALDSEMNVVENAVVDFVEQHKGQPFLIFGFTFMVWTKLVQHFQGRPLDLSNAIIVHSGGWKKLEEIKVTNEQFRARLAEQFNVTRVYNFYGFVEQLGSIFLEAEDGLLYAPSYADVIVRDPKTLRPLPAGETGLLQIVSLLPKSYPGHSILTEDLGVVRRIDNPDAARMGKGIQIFGRLPASELRGCSDVIAAGA